MKTGLEDFVDSAKRWGKRAVIAGMTAFMLANCGKKGSTGPDLSDSAPVWSVQAPATQLVGDVNLNYSARDEDGISQLLLDITTPTSQYLDTVELSGTTQIGVYSIPALQAGSVDVLARLVSINGETNQNATSDIQSTTTQLTNQNSPASLQLQVPNSATGTFDVAYNAQDADSLQDLIFDISLPDTAYADTLALSGEQVNDTYSIPAQAPGQAQIQATLRSNNLATGELEITVQNAQTTIQAPDNQNSPASLQLQVPNSATGTFDVAYNAQDADSLQDLIFDISLPDTAYADTLALSGEQVNDTYSIPAQAPGQAQIQATLRSNNLATGELEITVQNAQTTIQAPDNQAASLRITAPSTVETGQDYNVRIQASDADGLRELVASGALNFTRRFNNETAFDTTIVQNQADAQTLQYNAQLTSNTPTGEETLSESAQTRIEQAMETRNLDLYFNNQKTGNPIQGVAVEIPFGGQTLTGTTDEQGCVRLTYQTAAGAVDDLQVRGLRHAYDDISTTLQADGNEEMTYELKPSDIVFTTNSVDLEPRSQRTVTLSDLVTSVDEDTNTPVDVQGDYVSADSRVTITESPEGVYLVSLNNDPAGVSIPATLSVQSESNSLESMLDVLVGQRAVIADNGMVLFVTEDDSAQYDNFINRFSSAAKIVSFALNDNANIDVEIAGAAVKLKPTPDYFGSTTLTGTVENAHGSILDLSIPVDVQRLPRLTLTYEINATDAAPNTDGLVSAIRVQSGPDSNAYEEADGEVIVKMKGDVYASMNFERNGQPFGYVTTDTVSNTGVDQHVLIRAEDWYLRDVQGNVVGELKAADDPTSEGIDNVETYRTWILEKTRSGINNFNLDGPRPQGYFFKWFTETPGKGPAEVILSQTTRYATDNKGNFRIFTMNSITEDIIRDFHVVYQQIIGDQLPDITDIDSITYNNFDNEHRNRLVYSGFDGGGRVSVFGTDPNTVLSGIAYTTSDQLNTNIHDVTRIHLAESYGIMTFSRGDDEDFATRQQSVGVTGHQLQELTPYNHAMLRIVWEPTYTGSTLAKFGMPDMSN